jgi:anti-sigma regulatory factor (Ser/Thr protein kinase)
MAPRESVLRFPPTLAGFEQAAARLNTLLGRDIAERARYNVELAFEEVVTNVVRHGGATGEIEAVIRFADDEIVLTVQDDGVPFDPRERPNRVIPSSLDEAPVGGLGLVLLKNIVTRMTYERTSQQRNVLTLTIRAR